MSRNSLLEAGAKSEGEVTKTEDQGQKQIKAIQIKEIEYMYINKR